MIRVEPGTALSSLIETLLVLSATTPAELARASGYAEGQVSKWRRGVVVPTAPVLFRLADALGFEVALVPKRDPDGGAGL